MKQYDEDQSFSGTCPTCGQKYMEMTEKQVCQIITELTGLITHTANQNYNCLHEDTALDMSVDFYEKTLSPILRKEANEANSQD